MTDNMPLFEITNWLNKQSTVGISEINLPPLPDDGDLGFQLPDPPTTTVEAITIIQNFRS